MPSKLQTELLISAGVEGLDHIDRVIAALNAAGQNTEELAKESARLRAEWKNLNPDQQAERMRQLGDATNKASTDSDRLSESAERNVGVFTRLRGAIVAVGAALGVAFVVGKIKAFFSDAVSGASDFESQLATVKAVSGATSDEMDRLREAAQKMGSETRYTATEAAQAIENLSRAGLSASESIEALPSVLALAQGNSLELADAASYITQAVRGMGLEMEDAGRVADVLAKAAASANTDVAGLGQALSYAAPTASSLGVSLEEVVAVIGKFADAGIDASRAGTALNNIMSQFSNPASAFKRELAAIGIRTDNFTDAIRQLAAAGPNAQKAINALGQEAGPAMKALLSQGVGALDELKSKLDDAGGTAAAQAAEMDNTLQGAFASLSSAWDSLKQSLAAPILEPIAQKTRELGEVVRDIVSSGKITELGQKIAEIFRKSADAVIGFVKEFDFGALIDRISAGFEKLSTVGRGLNGAFQALNIAVQGVKSGFATLGIVITTIVQVASNAALGIIGIGAAVSDFFGITDNAVNKIVEKLDTVNSAATNARASLVGVIEQSGESIAASARSIAGNAEDAAQQASAALATIPAAAEEAAQKATNPIIALYQTVTDKVKEVTGAAQAEADKQAKAAEEAAQRTKDAQEKAAVAAKDAFAGLGVDLDEVFGGVSSKARKAMGDYTFAVEQATAAGLDATTAARAGFEKLAESLDSPQEWAAFKQHLIDSGFDLDNLTKNQLKRMEDSIKGLPSVAKTAMESLRQQLDIGDGASFTRIKAEAKSAFEAGEISAKQYQSVLQEIADKTDELNAKTTTHGDVAAAAHKKAADAAKEEAATHKEAAEAKAESASQSMQLYDATNLSADAIDVLKTKTTELNRAIATAFADMSLGAAEQTRRLSAEIKDYTDSITAAQGATARLYELTDAGTVTMYDVAQAAQAARGGIEALDSTTLANLNAAIDAARQKMADMRQEAEDTRASLEAQLASLRGDDSVARALDEQKKLRELNLKLQEAEAKGQREIADEYRRAIELQKQVFDEERRQQQQRKADEAKRKEEADKRQSDSTSGNNNRGNSSNQSSSASPGISARDVADAWDARIAEAEKRGAENFAHELYKAAKRRAR